MGLIQINFGAMRMDIRQHLDINRNKYILGMLIFVLAFALGIASGLRISQPYNALRFNNADFIAMLEGEIVTTYIVSLIFGQLFVFALLMGCCLHLYCTPLTLIVLFWRAYAAAVHTCLLMRYFGLAAVPMLLFALIPLYLLTFALYCLWAVYLFGMAHSCYYYGISPCLIFHLREIWLVCLLFVASLVVICAIFGSVVTALAGGLA